MADPLFEDPLPSPGRRTLVRLACMYAWLCVAASLLALGTVIIRRAANIEEGHGSLMGWTDADGVRHAGSLLSYDHQDGFALAVALFVALALLALGSTRRVQAIRQGSLLLLLAWSCVLLAGAARQLLGSGGTGPLACTVGAALAVGASYVRARARWAAARAPRPRPAPSAVAA
jgi:hypothetical protein